MTDSELADAIIERLNAIITDPAVRLDIDALMKAEVVCSNQTQAHPTLQVVQAAPDAPPVLRVLGLLNGIAGTIPAGKLLQGWGLIAAEFDDDDKLVRFLRTDVG